MEIKDSGVRVKLSIDDNENDIEANIINIMRQIKYKFLFNKRPLPYCTSYRYLGCNINECLDYNYTTGILAESAGQALSGLCQISHLFCPKSHLFAAFIYWPISHLKIAQICTFFCPISHLISQIFFPNLAPKFCPMSHLFHPKSHLFSPILHLFIDIILSNLAPFLLNWGYLLAIKGARLDNKCAKFGGKGAKLGKIYF